MMKDVVVEELLLYPAVNNDETAGAFAILQCKHNSDKMFLSYEHIGGKVDLEDYNYIEDYALVDEMKKKPVGVILEKIFESFNLDKPADFHGHSLSVSDIVALLTPNGVKFYFVDSIGFKLLDL